ncbi:glycosyltransferase [Vitiosangium sp. GDMCC 1.1324]|uniref:glycosyltransferase n=1 Tax=Vitiosangium sp. (strain GDMCC 1.1324) TaxID=2138576 RepID=UPI000D335F25|nr:glycosyltransferase [Vitiosangium sp. GDMCC 1.1324]PTL76373.1 glycosyl transferase family 1 [Vitiosangium sp. GDMCC 1.1324]
MAGRVLHLAAGNLYGGVETFLVTLARAPRRLKHRFALFFEGRLASELREAGADVEVLGPARLGRPWTLIGPQLRLNRLLTTWRPDLVLTHSTWLKLVAAPALLGQRQALFVHGQMDPRNPLDRLMARFPPRALLANSAFTAASASALVPRLTPLVAGCPVEDRIPKEPGVRQAVRQELGVSEGTTVILQVSRMEPGKGHALLVEALARLGRDAAWECWLAGGVQRPEEQSYLERLRAQVAEYGLTERVRFLGQRPDLPRLFTGADVFCHPNVVPEGFGIVFVEAMYAGLPVLTTDMGGAREIVDETCGARVQPRADAVAEVLARWVTDSGARQALGRAGRQRAEGLYLPSIGVSRLEDALERAMRD